MRFRGTLYHGADECWTMDSDDTLKLLMASNMAMARERQGRKGSCDGGTILRDGVAILTLANEHWVGI